jgi:hypothetical protein
MNSKGSALGDLRFANLQAASREINRNVRSSNSGIGRVTGHAVKDPCCMLPVNLPYVMTRKLSDDTYM